MSAAFAVRYITLRPKTNPEEFEAFITSACPTLPAFPGMMWSIVKGERGDRANRFAALYSYESLEVRNRSATEAEVIATDAMNYLAELADFFAKIDEFGSSFSDLVLYTDYPVIAEF